MRCVCVSLRTSLLLYRGGMPAYALLFECKGTLTRKKEKELGGVINEHNARSGGTPAAPRESYLDNGLKIYITFDLPIHAKKKF